MELKLDRKEVEDVLLTWASGQFPGKFNAVLLNGRYSSFSGAEFSFEHPEETADTPLKAEA